MTYSFLVIVALIAVLIIHFGILFHPKEDMKFPGFGRYRLFVIAVILFFLADLCWGFFYDPKWIIACYVETTCYFIFLCLTVAAWCFFITEYIESKRAFHVINYVIGGAFLIGGLTIIIINFFVPILFDMSETGEYKPGWARYLFFSSQILLFTVTTFFGFLFAYRDKEKRHRYMALSFFGLAMTASIFAQIYLPLYPCYSSGCLIGLCILRRFVIAAERDDYRKTIRESEIREYRQQQELDISRHLTYTDPLTGVLSRHAYVEKEEMIDKDIREGRIEDFAIIVFDLNNLKKINDTLGHEAGDQYIIKSAKMMQKYFEGVDLYRFGGDEFVAILTDKAYSKRETLLGTFDKRIDQSGKDEPIVATGIACFQKGEDNTFRAVFLRADEKMYQRKTYLKEKKAKK